MGVKSQHRIQGLEEVETPKLGRQDTISDTEALHVLHGPGKPNTGFEDIVAGLEKSDAFLQRRTVINSEIERQLKTTII